MLLYTYRDKISREVYHRNEAEAFQSLGVFHRAFQEYSSLFGFSSHRGSNLLQCLTVLVHDLAVLVDCFIIPIP